MKKIIAFLAICIFPSMVLAAQTLDRVVAVVNDDIITSAELQDATEQFNHQLAAAHQPRPSEAVLTKKVLDSLIMDKLGVQMAKEHGITIDDNALNHAVAKIASEHGLTLAEFKQELQRSGSDMTTFRYGLKNKMLIGKLMSKEIGQNIRISDNEVTQFLKSPEGQEKSGKQFHLKHILLQVPEESDHETIATLEKQAKSLIKKLKQGTDIEKIAQENDAIKPRDLGWRKLNELPTLFVAPALHMKKNEIRGPFKSASGFHIIKLMDTRKAAQRHHVKETRARHILIKETAVTSSKDAKIRAQELRKKILAGKKFDTVAKAYSDDKVSGADGGSLGWVTPGMMVKPFESAMNELKKDEISQPIHTQFWWHLIQVLDRRDTDNTEAFLKHKAQEYLYHRKFDKALLAWQEEQRDNAYIDIRIS